tara:strand:+ start:398 stop:973 length:576 start_codon:yes stop_codon:yes gene_type:complete
MTTITSMTSMTSNTIKALEYGIKLIGIPYDYWSGDENQKDEPMFAQNGKVPHQLDITSANCAGLCNLMLRSVDKELPYSNKTQTIGGTDAYFEYYKDKSYDFSLENTYPMGTLLMRDYRDINDQGHVAVLLDTKGKDSLVLQSHVEGEFHKSTKPGVNAMYSLEESHKAFTDGDGNGCYYERVVLPDDWLE